jgi:glucose-6-phosphate 1-dehydrogenase
MVLGRRWEGVKLYFKAGKALDDRSSYAKVRIACG